MPGATKAGREAPPPACCSISIACRWRCARAPPASRPNEETNAVTSPETAPYRNPALTPDARARDLLARMTTTEKVAQLRAIWLKLHPGGRYEVWERMTDQGTDADAFIAEGIGQITRPFGTHPIDPADGARALAAVQRFLIHKTRLGIPALPHDECLSGLMGKGATQFPSPVNYGATWNPDLIGEVGAIISRQMRAVGSRQGLAPVADVVRDARWGRVEECVGEDPYLVGMLVTRYVQGMQAGGLGKAVAATLKHYAGHSAGEGGRNLAPVHAGPREMREIFLLPFEMAVKEGGCASVMSAYHDVDGVPASASRWLLTEVLRDEWGFDGTVVADYNIVRYLHTKHRIAGDKAEAAAAALNAGLDVELPTSEYYRDGLPEALARGLLDQATLDQAVIRVLRQKFALGLFEQDYDAEPPVTIHAEADAAVARRVAEQSLVLLKNDGVLPLDAARTRIAVIGPNAFDQMALFGNYNYPTNVFARFEQTEIPKFAPTVLEAITARFGSERVSAARGCRILNGKYRRVRHPSEGPTPDPDVQVISDDRSEIPAAVAAAKAADVAVLVIGDRAGHFQTGTVGEGTDVDDTGLTAVQRELAEAVLATGTPVVVVLVNGRPLAIGDIAERAAAILVAWFPGEEGAAAIAGALAGDINPGGKTPVSFARSAGAQPFFYNHKALSAGLPLLPHFGAVFPFGHGLSYTRFAYEDLRLSADAIPADGTVEIGFTLRNTGDCAGDEVVQLYVTDVVASLARPVKELKGFARIHLAPGEAKRITFVLPAEMLWFVDAAYRTVVEPGDFAIGIGASSADIRLTDCLRLTGATRILGRDRKLVTPVRIDPE